LFIVKSLKFLSVANIDGFSLQQNLFYALIHFYQVAVIRMWQGFYPGMDFDIYETG